MTGFPQGWRAPRGWSRSDGRNIPNWVTGGPDKGIFVGPNDGPIYLTARVKANQVLGYGTWFAFWALSETQNYQDNDFPAPIKKGTELDIVEIFNGPNPDMENAYTVNNHIRKDAVGSVGKRFDPGPNHENAHINVRDNNYHDYGMEWYKGTGSNNAGAFVKFYVDGKLVFSTTRNIPTDPDDMMMLLTMEFKPGSWGDGGVDGRYTGPKVKEESGYREMSRVLVDHVHVYRKN